MPGINRGEMVKMLKEAGASEEFIVYIKNAPTEESKQPLIFKKVKSYCENGQERLERYLESDKGHFATALDEGGDEGFEKALFRADTPNSKVLARAFPQRYINTIRKQNSHSDTQEILKRKLGENLMNELYNL